MQLEKKEQYFIIILQKFGDKNYSNNCYQKSVFKTMHKIRAISDIAKKIVKDDPTVRKVLKTFKGRRTIMNRLFKNSLDFEAER